MGALTAHRSLGILEYPAYSDNREGGQIFSFFREITRAGDIARKDEEGRMDALKSLLGSSTVPLFKSGRLLRRVGRVGGAVAAFETIDTRKIESL